MKFSYKSLIVLVPVLSLFIDSLGFFIQDYVIYIRAVVLMFVFFLLFIYKVNFKIDVLGKCLLFFFSYLSITGYLYSTDFGVTLGGLISVLFSFLFYIISYNIFDNFNDLKKFYIWIVLVSLIISVNITLLTYFQIGTGIYGEVSNLRFGALHHNRIYLGSLTIAIFFVLYKYRDTKIYHVIFAAILLVFILLSWRRTAILLILFSFIVYMITSYKKDAFKVLIILSMLLFASFPFYKDSLYLIIQDRGQDAYFEDGIDSESRIVEMAVVSEKVLSFDDIQYSLLGYELFNSFGTYATPAFPVLPTRILHTDYAVILHGSGLIGLLLYLIILFVIIYKAFVCSRMFGYKDDISVLMWISIVFFIVSLLSGGLLNITFRSGYFILLGYLMKVSDDRLMRLN